MSLELARTLLLSEALDRPALARALRSHVQTTTPLPRALADAGVDPTRIDGATATWEGPSVMRVLAQNDLLAALPSDLCSRLFALPIRRDPETGVVDVAVVDPNDPHPLAEIAFALQSPVRAVRAPMQAIAEALEARAHRPESLAPPIWLQKPGTSQKPGTFPGLGPFGLTSNVARSSRTPAWGMPAPTSDDDPPSQRYEPIPLTVRRDSQFVPNEEAVVALDQNSRPLSEAPIPLVTARDSSPEMDDALIPRPPFADPSAVLDAMRAAKARDDVMRALLQGARAVAARVGLLVVKRDVFVGWSCSPELCALADWSRVQVSTGYPSALATASAEGTYLGSVHPSEAHRPLLAAVRTASRDVAITPVKVGARPTLLVYADGLGDPALSTRRLEDLARAAGDALGRILREKR